MTRRWSDIPSDRLVDHGAPDQIDRVWKRLESNLSVPQNRPAPAPVRWWLPVGAVGVFGLGVIVGALGFASEPARVTPMAPEPARVLEPRAAAPSIDHDELEPGKQASERAEPERRRGRLHKVSSPRPGAPPSASSAPPPADGEEMAELAVAGPPEWQRLADDGVYEQALRSVESAGGFDAVLSGATAEQLMLLVDVARATGQRARAVEALRAIVNLHGSDPNAPVAAWMLGNELMKLADPHGAAQAFAMYRALSPRGDFAEDALARQFEVAVEQGHLKQARTLAEQYAKNFPDGPRGGEIRERLARLEQRLLAAERDAGVSLDGGSGAPALSPVDGGVPR